MPAIILSDNGATSGSAGLKTSGGNDGVLQLQTTTSGGTPTTAISISNTQVVTYTNQPTYTGGTANGVLYLNGSKAVTSGTALVFDGTNLGVGVAPISLGAGYTSMTINNATNGGGVTFATGGVGKANIFNAGNALYIDRNNAAGVMYLRNTANGTTDVTLDASGNFLIAATTARTRLTLQAGEANAPTLGTASGGAFFGNSSVAYGTLFGTSGSGYGWIQQQRVDGTGTAYDLCLQPSGGNVLVGTITAVEKITVTAGSIRTTSDNSCIVNGNDANLGFVKKGGYDGHLTVSSSSPMIFSRLNQSTITSATVVSGTPSEFARFDTSGNLLVGQSARPVAVSNYIGSIGEANGLPTSVGMSGSTWVNLVSLTAASFTGVTINIIGAENGNVNVYFGKWTAVYATGGWALAGPFEETNSGNNYGQPNLRMSGSTVQVQARNGVSSGVIRVHLQYFSA